MCNNDNVNREKLTYTKYQGCNNILVIDLHNGYSIIALKMWNMESTEYKVDFKIKADTIDKWETIDDNLVEFKTGKEIINSAILKYVSNCLENGYYDKYIDRFEYECKCFDLGNTVLETVNNLG